MLSHPARLHHVTDEGCHAADCLLLNRRAVLLTASPWPRRPRFGGRRGQRSLAMSLLARFARGHRPAAPLCCRRARRLGICCHAGRCSTRAALAGMGLGAGRQRGTTTCLLQTGQSQRQIQRHLASACTARARACTASWTGLCSRTAASQQVTFETPGCKPRCAALPRRRRRQRARGASSRARGSAASQAGKQAWTHTHGVQRTQQRRWNIGVAQ